LEQAGMVPAAIADELGIPDRRLRQIRMKSRMALEVLQTASNKPA
jgi:hypothetical protein